MVRITPPHDSTVVIKRNKSDGFAAYERGDYDTAFKELKPLAEQGDTDAQHSLGVMYDTGQGVPQDYKEAATWYRKAAEQGYAPAQYNLGAMYANGEGVPPDDVLAYMWFSLARTQGNEIVIENRDLIAERMTHEQIVEAQILAREWKPEE